MNIDDFLKLPAISFFDELMQSEVSKTDIIRYIDENFDNNTDLLKAFKEDAASYKLYYDTEYQEKYYAEQSAILGKQLRNGEETTIPYHYEPDIQMVMDELKKIDDFKTKSQEEKRELREKIKDEILNSYPPDKPKAILLDIKYPYNWDTHSLGKLINILDHKINDLKRKERGVPGIVMDYLGALKKFYLKEISEDEILESRSNIFDFIKEEVEKIEKTDIVRLSKILSQSIAEWSFSLIFETSFFSKELSIKENKIGDLAFCEIVDSNGDQYQEYQDIDTYMFFLINSLKKHFDIFDIDFYQDLNNEISCYLSGNSNTEIYPPIWFFKVIALNKSKLTTQTIEKSYRIAKGQKINFIKIINAMRELNMFETPDGLLVSNKQKFIKDLALFFNENIEDYSQSLSASKGNKNYLDIFDKLKEIAEKDLD